MTFSANLAALARRVVGAAAGNLVALDVNGKLPPVPGDLLTGVQRPWTELAPVATTAGTAIDIANLPAGITDVEVWLEAVKNGDATGLLVQIGTGGAPTTTGYISGSGVGGSSSRLGSTAGFIMFRNSAVNVVRGAMRLHRITGNRWAESHAVNYDGAAAAVGEGSAGVGGGTVTLAGDLDNLRLRTVGGATAFDNGAMQVRYR